MNYALKWNRRNGIETYVYIVINILIFIFTQLRTNRAVIFYKYLAYQISFMI